MKKQPDIRKRAPRDLAGVEIKVGSSVAFNRSGDVELGVVKEIGGRLRKGYHPPEGIVWRRHYVFTIRCYRDGKFSKAQIRSVAVIWNNAFVR